MGLNNYSTNNRSRSSKPDANCPTFKELREKSEDESLRRAANNFETYPMKWNMVKKTKKELKEELGEQGYKKFKEKRAKDKAKYYKRQRQQQYKDMTTLPEWFR